MYNRNIEIQLKFTSENILFLQLYSQIKQMRNHYQQIGESFFYST